MQVSTLPSGEVDRYPSFSKTKNNPGGLFHRCLVFDSGAARGNFVQHLRSFKYLRSQLELALRPEYYCPNSADKEVTQRSSRAGARRTLVNDSPLVVPADYWIVGGKGVSRQKRKNVKRTR